MGQALPHRGDKAGIMNPRLIAAGARLKFVPKSLIVISIVTVSVVVVVLLLLSYC